MKSRSEHTEHTAKRHSGLLLPAVALAAAALVALSGCAANQPGGASGGSSQASASEPAAPDKAVETAEKWAEAVKNRDGKAQYELMTPALQKKVYDEFTGLNWVTGTSSPWVERYTVQQTGAGAQVSFDYASSTGSAGTYRQELMFEESDGVLKISSISDPVQVDSTASGSGEAEALRFSDLIGLLGMTQEELLSAMGNETPIGVDEGGLGFEKAGIRVWFDDATHTKAAQVLIMTDKIDLNGVRKGDSFRDFQKVFGEPVQDSNGDARFAYNGVYLSVIRDIASDSDKTIGVYILQENL